MRALASLLSAALLTFAASAAAAQIYKYTDANGRVVYTDDPKAAHGAAEPVKLALLSIVPALPSATVKSTERRLVGDAVRRAAGLDRASADIVTASRALEQAQEQQQIGIEPLEGERQGRRFRNEYWQRQATLALQVQTAQASLDNAIARRNALR